MTLYKQKPYTKFCNSGYSITNYVKCYNNIAAQVLS